METFGAEYLATVAAPVMGGALTRSGVKFVDVKEFKDPGAPPLFIHPRILG